MKKFLSDHLTKIIIFGIFYIICLGLLVIPLNYSVIAPGGLTNLSGSFEIEGVEMDDHFYSIYVYSQDPITIFQYLILKNNDNYEINEITQRQSDTSYLDSFKQGNISKEVSYKTAIIKSYELASEVDDSIVIDYTYDGLIIYDYPRRVEEISIGDIITEVDGVSLRELNFIDSKIIAYQQDVTYTIVNSDGEVYEYTYHYEDDDVLFWFFPSYTITEANPTYDYSSINMIGGPSGGLLQTLSIYASLVNVNISDVVISGTGTIEMTGDIGRIGGIREKITTANRENVDYFLIPSSHVDEIIDMEFSFELVAIDTIEQAVQWLYENVVEQN